MGLFSKDTEPVAAHPAPATHNRYSTDSDSPKRSHGLFGSRHSSSPDAAPQRTSTTSTRTSVSSGGHGVLSRFGHKEDPSITGARQRVHQAEQAEKEADAALIQARAAVRDAREHVKALEREAEEEARLAKIKQAQAKDISKRGANLGRKYCRCCVNVSQSTNAT